MSLRFYLVQSALAWEDPAANLSHFAEQLEAQPPAQGSVVVLPEMFSTGFSMASARLAEPMSGPTVQWMKDMSRQLSAILTGSLIIEAAGQYYNRLLWVKGDDVTTYDKRHLFRMTDEHKHFSMGSKRVLLEAGGVNICPQVCYDLRFPVWTRNANEYDVLLYVANWPAARADQWLALLRARAIENQCYVIAVNRIGADGKGVEHQGDSVVFDYQGNLLLELGAKAGLGEVEIDTADMHAYRTSFPAWQDADRFNIID